VELHVTLDGRRDLTGQIYRQVRGVIVTGRLRPGEALPPSRELAHRLSVSRTTVSAAYDRLAAEGFVSGRVGAGTFVADGVSLTGRPVTGPAPASPLQPLPFWGNGLRGRWDLSAVKPEFDLRVGMPDARLFPYQTWRRLMGDQLRTTAVGAGAYSGPAGLPAVREALARHVGVSRAVQVTPEQIIMTNGVQQSVDLIARVMLRPGDRAVVEDPGYPPPAMLLRSLGARVTGVPVDDEGLVVDRIPDDTRLVYVTPSHQFPLGVRMSLARRTRLLDWAREREVVIVEDDYDTEFRYAGRPLEPLHTLDRDGRVVYLGSLSKTMLPTLRLGFAVVPESLRDAVAMAKFTADWHSPLPTQAALAEFVADGTLARHVRRMRAVYAERHRLVADALSGPLSAYVEMVPAAAGLHLAALLRTDSVRVEREVLHRARAAGIEVFGLSGFCLGERRPGLVIGFGMIPTERVPEALARLEKVLQDVR
jgi:GntR family transcriptional regulator / MocR family aminotransferase